MKCSRTNRAEFFRTFARFFVRKCADCSKFVETKTKNGDAMKYQFLYYPRCGTSNKAAKWLREQGIEVEQRDIVLDQTVGR